MVSRRQCSRGSCSNPREVQLRFVDAERSTPLTQQLAETATPRTRAFCTTWVDSFTGRRLDIDEIGTVCHEHDVLFVLNGTEQHGPHAPVGAVSLHARKCQKFQYRFVPSRRAPR
nr:MULTISPECIES: aminotransferase class V-fold PLP-dependent enzyme [unclassified Haloferax]